MNKKELNKIKLEYAKFLYEIENNEFYKNIELSNRVNTYICSNGHVTKTIDIDAGVTPFIHICEKCGEVARSSFYNDTHPDLEPTQEWYRPSLKKLLKMSEEMREHILNGGLDVRVVK